MKKKILAPVDLTRPQMSASYFISLILVGIVIILAMAVAKGGAGKITSLVKSKVPAKDGSVELAADVLGL